MLAPVTSIYAALAGIIIFGLAYRVVRLRRRERIALGHGDNKHLRRAIRVHANATENIPVILILMLLLEINGGATWALHLFGILTILGRLIHAWWLSRFTGKSFGRTWGTVISWGVLIALAVLNLRLAVA